MRIGVLGIGRLGLPVSVAIAQKGHTVYGYDVDENKRVNYRKGITNLYEPEIDYQLQQELGKKLHIVDEVRETIEGSDIVFIAVPTPSKSDDSFDLAYVVSAIASIGKELRSMPDRPVITVISTILPMSMRKYIAPAFERASGLKPGREIGLCYSAQFIAMGSTISDYLNPEFCIIGESDRKAGAVLEEYYNTIVAPDVPKLHMSWENAELTKMAYNTMIGFKIVYANTLMEMCNKMPYADCDVVSSAIVKAKVRILGPRYLRGGMGDAGACHPRDNLALSWLSRQMGISANLFEAVMDSRTKQAAFVANTLIGHKKPIVVMAVRYKNNTNLIDYSSSLQVADAIKKKGRNVFLYDPLVPQYSKLPPKRASVFLIGQDVPFVHDYDYPPGSVIVDVWRCFQRSEVVRLASKSPPVKYVPIGRHPLQPYSEPEMSEPVKRSGKRR